ncbi:glycosyl hydrolase family 18 protein [Herbivorax sp. ANBcel31]|uniref:glycosyl hydrolase family 18 protein n=1 Tax=Herbivorax sp. ANBcel31 TaxID=3069754 RepID=UPI0027AE3257|nr:glycosyl hydrolase family 18 protein [Herbivorax sp. ANBcel31]MDQ2087432.1 glycosyl hydrolase family 18 protein [Herbivorax sp. ANBcel31]
MENIIKKSIVLSLLFGFFICLTVFSTQANAQSKNIVGYFTEWGIYLEDNYYEVSNIPWNKVTHINYAFAKIEDGEIAIHDTWAAIERPFDDDTWETPIKGHFGQLIKYKQLYPDVKTLISVGGWTMSTYFSDVALTDESRELFAKSCVDFIREYQFDGVDIDWEYPVGGGLDTNITRPEDKENFTLLLQTLREELDIAGTEDGKDYLLTIAAPAGSSSIDNMEPDKFHQYLDFINLMTYDYSGSWEDVSNHLSPLYMNPSDPSSAYRKERANIDWTVNEYLKLGVPAEKLNLGIPYYAAGWTDITGGTNGLFGSASEGLTTRPFHYIKDILNSPNSSYEEFFDQKAKSPYIWDDSTGTMYTYIDENSLEIRCDYVLENNLAGFMIWELSGDYPKEGGDTLTTLIYDNIESSSLPKPLYGDINGDGVVDSTDLTLLKRYILNIIDSFPFAGASQNADVNGDGKIDSTDYALIERYILEVIDELPLKQ